MRAQWRRSYCRGLWRVLSDSYDSAGVLHCDVIAYTPTPQYSCRAKLFNSNAHLIGRLGT
eukprot:4966912-Pyramimonas_sp.AAC.1